MFKFHTDYWRGGGKIFVWLTVIDAAVHFYFSLMRENILVFIEKKYILMLYYFKFKNHS